MPNKSSNFNFNILTSNDLFDIDYVNDNFKILESTDGLIIDSGTMVSDGITWFYKRYNDKTIELYTYIDISNCYDGAVGLYGTVPYYSNDITVKYPVLLSEVYDLDITFFGMFTRIQKSNGTRTDLVTLIWPDFVENSSPKLADIINFKLMSYYNQVNSSTYAYTLSASACISVKGVEV